MVVCEYCIDMGSALSPSVGFQLPKDRCSQSDHRGKSSLPEPSHPIGPAGLPDRSLDPSAGHNGSAVRAPPAQPKVTYGTARALTTLMGGAVAL